MAWAKTACRPHKWPFVRMGTRCLLKKGSRETIGRFCGPRQGREGSGDVPRLAKPQAPPLLWRTPPSGGARGGEVEKRWLATADSAHLIHEKRARRTRFSWRWAESNRRPNKAPEGFLHAYPAFDCRGTAAGGRANVPLASES